MPGVWGSSRREAPNDRISAEVARSITERLLPDPEFRRFALESMGELIDSASEIEPESWSISLFRRMVRLNVAWTWGFDIGENKVGVAIKDGILGNETVGSLTAGLEYWKEGPEGLFVTLKPGDEDLWADVRQAALARVKEVVDGRARFAQTHSPGFVRYLERELGRTFDDSWQIEQRAEVEDREMAKFVEFAQSLPDDHFGELNRQAEAERAEILRRFPEAGWPEMALEDYAVGQPDREHVYSTYLEFRSRHLGSIGGGSAMKHGIYYSKKKKAWQYKDEYDSVDEAWEDLRRGFLELLRLADEGQWVEIDETLPLANMIRVKTLYVYRPERVLPIASKRHLRFFLETFGKKHSEVTGQGSVALNRQLLEILRSQRELEKYSNHELGMLLYQWRHPHEVKRFMKVAPGEDAELWEDCLQNNCIRVGWPRVGDLSQYETKSELRAAFAHEHGADHNNHGSTISRIVNDLWEYRELEPGDTVVANRGTHEVLAIGEVQAPGYEFREDENQEYPHYVRVEWDTRYAKEITPQAAWRNTIQRKIPVSVQLKILERDGAEIDGPAPPPPEEFDEISTALEQKGQVVLFGPPGTGKTYVARRFALWWSDNGPTEVASALRDEEAFSKFESEVDARRKGNRTWLVVANPRKQDWAWKDLKDDTVEFTEGNVKRNFPMVEVGDLVIGYEAGTSKRIQALGRVSKPFRETDEGRSFQVEHLHDVTEGPTFHELRADEVLKNAQGISSGCRGTLFALTEQEADTLIEMILERDPDVVGLLQTETSAPTITRVTFHPSYAYEDFVEGFRPAESTDGTLRLQLEDGVFKRVCREASVAPDRKFLLLIDEINRGNVAKIFGELITLLERDKRGMIVTLPQSKEPFSVPPNVYVLATMNTADRSLRHLDAALRRRFQFIEMLPDTDLLAGYTVRNLALDEFLDTINTKIIKAFGREKQVGHSFLMTDGAALADEEEFAFRFRYEILPLIQEYCYDDFRQLADFFGKDLVDVEMERFDQEVLGDSGLLLDALESHFRMPARAAAE